MFKAALIGAGTVFAFSFLDSKIGLSAKAAAYVPPIVVSLIPGALAGLAAAKWGS